LKHVSLNIELLSFKNCDVLQNCVQICNQWIRTNLKISIFHTGIKLLFFVFFWTG